MPIIHLLILLKNAVNLLILSSLDRFAAIEKAIIVTVNGKTMDEIAETIKSLKNATAGFAICTDTAPPLAAIKVSIMGKTSCICVCIDDILVLVFVKHSVKTAIKGIKVAV